MSVWFSMRVIGSVLTVSIVASLRSASAPDVTHDAPIPDALGLLTDGSADLFGACCA